jgi:hypothetical protein
MLDRIFFSRSRSFSPTKLTQQRTSFLKLYVSYGLLIRLIESDLGIDIVTLLMEIKPKGIFEVLLCLILIFSLSNNFQVSFVSSIVSFNLSFELIFNLK